MVSATPILDLELDPPQPKVRRWPLGLGVFLGVPIGLAPLWIPEGWPDFNPLLMIPALWLTILVHETGHMLSAKLAGFKLGAILVAGLNFWQEGQHWMFRFRPSAILSGFILPQPAAKGAGRTRYAVLVAGGPLSSLALVALLWLAHTVKGDGTWSWIATFFWCSWCGLISLLPLRNTLSRSDVARLWMLFKNPEDSRSWTALLDLQAQNAQGVLPRNWSPALVSAAVTSQPGCDGYAYRQFLACLHLIDRGCEADSLAHLEKALAHSGNDGNVLRQVYYLTAAGASADFRCNPQQARIWRSRAIALRKPETTASTDAAIAISEQRYDDALKHLRAARDFLVRRKLDSGLAVFAKEQIATEEAKCRTAIAAVHPLPNSSVTAP